MAEFGNTSEEHKQTNASTEATEEREQQEQGNNTPGTDVETTGSNQNTGEAAAAPNAEKAESTPTTGEGSAEGETASSSTEDASAAGAESSGDATPVEGSSEAASPDASSTSASSQENTSTTPSKPATPEVGTVIPAAQIEAAAAHSRSSRDTSSGFSDEPQGDESDSSGGHGGRPQFPKLSEEDAKQIWDELAQRKQGNESIDLEVLSQNRGGVVTSYHGQEVFIPMSHWSFTREDSVDAPVGETIQAHVLEMTVFDTSARRVTATRRPIIRRELLDSLEQGQRIQGRVSSVVDFGAFVDIGGIEGLVHASEISHARGRHPSEMLKRGEEVEVVVKDVDRDKKKISLGMKELQPSPWNGAADRYPIGSIQQGKVVGLSNAGAFIELEPGVDGFVRLRELSWTKRVRSPREVLKKGVEIEAKVLDVSEGKQRLSLSYRQAQKNPWPELSEKFSTGSKWEGEVRDISNRGVVVSVEEVEGFLPRGRMGREAKRLPEMKVGEKLKVHVIEVEPASQSLIFGLSTQDDRGGGGGRPSKSSGPANEMKSAETVGNFTLGDMIGDALKKQLGSEEKARREGKKAEESKAREESKTPAESAPEAKAEEPKSDPVPPTESLGATETRESAQAEPSTESTQTPEVAQEEEATSQADQAETPAAPEEETKPAAEASSTSEESAPSGEAPADAEASDDSEKKDESGSTDS